MTVMEPQIALWVTKERFGVFRVETAAGSRSRYFLDSKTTEVKALRGSGARVAGLPDDPMSGAVKRAEAQGIKEGETKVILLQGRTQRSGRQLMAATRR